MPKEFRQLFRAGDITNNVVLNFTHSPKGELSIQGKAYHRAAKVLVQHFAAQAGYNDFDGYPVVFMYRQALELLLKAILLSGNKLATCLNRSNLETPEKTLFNTHGLSCHLPTLKSIFEVVGWQDAFEHAGLSNPDFETIIQEFQNFDPTSYAFRYTVKRMEQQHFPNISCFLQSNSLRSSTRFLRDYGALASGWKSISI
jgi:hypothetical protein